ncbi:hypothetical protein TUM4438_32410 [Shewanella sairae]|uniref:Uncharacterized protein n=1 Tax=Shewanella sairae TaxID=190310 RepID=A0ABQ4PM17_9GAMM|nr:hypothetical protein TUM4438_32410 [Shewanella sairae]
MVALSMSGKALSMCLIGTLILIGSLTDGGVDLIGSSFCSATKLVNLYWIKLHNMEGRRK